MLKALAVIPFAMFAQVPPGTVEMSPAFKLIFFSVLGLTILSLAACIALAISARQTDAIKNLIETTSTTWKMGFGAIIGLLGGKALP